MRDLALDSNFSVYLDGGNDLAVVEGQAAFEQSVVVMLTDYMQSTLTGITGSESTIKDKIRLQATRVARDHGALDSVEDIIVEPKPEEAGTYQVTILYLAGEDYQFDI